MKHFGDITKLDGHALPIVDIVTGGSPCQDLSVAGKRAGLAGERSGLFMEQIRLIKEMRNECVRQIQVRGTDEHIRPRYMVWENVPGAFSSNKGADFHAVLEETAKIADENAVIPRLEGGQRWSPSGCILGDGWSIAWRLHDAQFWGVPQRRKRIALVADFGGQSAPEILFEREGVSGNPSESRETGEDTTGYSEGDVDKTICLQGNGIDRADTAGCNGRGWREGGCYTLNTVDRPAVLSFLERAGKPGGVKESLSNMSESEPCQPSTTKACAPITTSHSGFTINADNSDVAQTVLATDYKDPQVVCYGLDRASFNQGQNALYDFSIEKDKAQCIVSRGPGGVMTKQ